jgi:hypothetical protein
MRCRNSSPRRRWRNGCGETGAGTDGQIDELVHELYGPTRYEIRIVEEGSGR